METDQTATPRQKVHRMKGLDVRYISLCAAGKNGRSIIAKAEIPDGAQLVEKAIEIRKSDEAKRMVYGVVYAPESVDADGHVASAEEIEKAMHGFMQEARVSEIDTNHNEETGVGYVAESWLTKADSTGAVVDPLFPDEPEGTWAVGIKVVDDASWQAVEKGEIAGLSLAGYATLEEQAAATATQKGSADDGQREDVAQGFVERVKVLLGIEPKADGAGSGTEKPPFVAEAEALAERKLAELVEKAARDGEKLHEPVDNYIPTPDRQAAPGTPELLAALAAMLGAGGAYAPRPAVETDPGTTPKNVSKAEAEGRATDATRLAKGFRERMLRNQMWRVADALTDGIRDVLDDEDVTDKAAGIKDVVAEFEAWLSEQMGSTSGAGGAEGVSMSKGDESVGEGATPTTSSALTVLPPDLVERVEALEKATPGRFSILGGPDLKVEKSKPNGLKIV